MARTKKKAAPAAPKKLPEGQHIVQVVRSGSMLSYPDVLLDSRSRAHILAETPDAGGALLIAHFKGGQEYERGMGWVYAPARIQVLRLIERTWKNIKGETWNALVLLDVPVRAGKAGVAPRGPEHVSVSTGGDPYKSVPAGVRRALVRHGIIDQKAAGGA